MKLLILSFRAGEGHNSAARAVAEAASLRGHEATVVDFLGLFSTKISTAVNGSYVSIAKHTPRLFGFLYGWSLWLSRHIRLLPSSIYLDSVIVSHKLRRFLKKTGPYDGIVATHLMPAQALSHLRRGGGYPLPTTVSVSTDFTCYPYWEESADCDFCVIPDGELTDLFVARGIKEEKIRPFGIPVGAKYSRLPSREEARDRLGFGQKTEIYLLMGGSMGAGHLKKFATKLAENAGTAHIVVICGKNKALLRSLGKTIGGRENVHLVGFTAEVPTYMAACDVLFSKPGGLTSSEALCCRIPTVHTTPIPGCESDNFKFFSSRGCSLPAMTMPEQLKQGIFLMEHPEARDEMRACQAKYAKPAAAQRIVELIEESRAKNVGEK